jgi:uncharacterized protein YyaL (SSP411 family)
VIKPSNRLIHESSPYLLQHAYNPVDWYPWGEEALQLARNENKPIIVSIGYAACHWCHVMEHESFEDEQTALLMNRYFVCIKVDREERPDLDHFFMDALQAIVGNGGWPLNMFLTSDGKPFYGGTYFPPVQVHNRVSWKDLLMKIHHAYHQRKDEVLQQAEELLRHLSRSGEVNAQHKKAFLIPNEELFTDGQTQQVFQHLMQAADHQHGGFGHAPKFPQTFSIQFLLRFAHFTGNKEALAHAELSLQSMIRGGIYDQVGGGFCRYATDGFWLAPHFEKMAYDNALLLIVLSEAFQFTGNAEYSRIMEETIGFLEREMLSPEGGFYAALDADSEGVEGKFYTWKKEEVVNIFGKDASWICELLDITEEGNWEHVNIPRMLQDPDSFAVSNDLVPEDFYAKFNAVKQKMLEARALRVRPGTDDKIILGWNALVNQGLIAAYQSTGKNEWLKLAEKNMDFILSVFFKDGKWLHTYKAGTTKFPAFLDDLSYLVRSMIGLQEVNGDTSLLEKSKDIVEYVMKYYSDEEGILFYFTPDFHTDVPVRKKDLYDGAMPSSNAVMAWNLHQLGILFNRSEWTRRSSLMLEVNREAAIKYPNSFGVWCNLLLEKTRGTHEIVIIGQHASAYADQLLRNFIPNRVLIRAEKKLSGIPLMSQRGEEREHETVIYVCRDYLCGLPVYSVRDALKQLLTKQ